MIWIWAWKKKAQIKNQKVKSYSYTAIQSNIHISNNFYIDTLQLFYDKYGEQYQFLIAKKYYKDGESSNPLLIWKKGNKYYAFSYTQKNCIGRNHKFKCQLSVFKANEDIKKHFKINSNKSQINLLKMQHKKYNAKKK